MPLIIHPSSCCDICLETLTYNDKPPFAIPCGHIFCRSCLFGLNPSLCPLCRKPFLPERSKKLITGDLEIPEVEGIEDKTAIKLLTKLVDSLDTEGRDSTILEVDVWLSAGNTHALLQRVHEVLKEYLVLKSERSASQRSMRRLQREMHRLQVDKSTEKENASAMEQELLSQVEELREKIRKFEERPRAATTIAFNHNPLPTPPEPFPLESLPSFANLQQRYNEIPSQNSSDRKTQSMPHLSVQPANPKVEGLSAAARTPSTDQMPIPSNPSTVNEHVTSHRNIIIPGASPNQRYIPRTVLEESSNSATTSIYEQSAVQVDPIALATDYFVEYAAGFQEGYQLSHRHLQSSNRQNRRERGPESVDPPVVEPTSQSRASSSQTLDDRLIQQSAGLSTMSRPVRRPLGLRDFYATPASFSPYRRDSPALAPRVPFGPPISSSSSSTPSLDEQPWLTSNWPTLSPSLTPTERSIPFPPVDRVSNSSSPLASPSTSPFLSVTSAISLDTESSRSFRTSSLSRAPERRSAERTSVEILWDSVSDIPASNIPDVRLPRRSASNYNSSVQSTPSLRVNESPASVRTIESWGTVSTRNSNLVFHRPFIPAYQIGSVSDLELRFFDDLTDPSRVRTTSQRSSLLSDVEQQFSPSHIGLEDSDNAGTSGSGFQNRTPRVVPRALPRTESLSSLEGGLPTFVLPQDADNYRNISNTIHLPHRDLDHDHNQHPSDASETWHRATADLTSIRSNLHTQSHPHSHSVSGSVSDRSSRTLRQLTSDSSLVATHDNPTSLRWQTSLESTNALGLTELTPSPELRISAPTPMTPSQPFLHYYNENSR